MKQAIVTLPSSPRPADETTCEARWVGVDVDGQPLIRVAGVNDTPVPARFLSHVLGNRRPGDAGIPVLIQLTCSSPVILGIIETRLEPVSCEIDGTRVSIEAERELELRCGPASLTLTRDGRVHIKGVEILSRSSGAQKIRGASVQIN